MKAYTKETGVDGEKDDYGQLLRIAKQLENEAKANDAPSKVTYWACQKRCQLMEFPPGSLMSERRTIRRSRHALMNMRMRLELAWIWMNSSWEY